jgi:hypothetical protein
MRTDFHEPQWFKQLDTTIDTVDILAPVDARMGAKNDLPRRLLRKVEASVGRMKPAFHNVLIDKEYELFFSHSTELRGRAIPAQ